MMLTSFLLVPLVGAILAWVSAKLSPRAPKWVALLALFANSALFFIAWNIGEKRTSLEDLWVLEFRWPWILEWGIEFHLGLDGLSFVLGLLTNVMGVLALITSWNRIKNQTGFFYFNLLLGVCGVLGVLLSLDLFLFFVFWEVMLIPIYFLVALWGYKRRFFAATQFFIFTQVSGLILLVSVLSLFFIHHAQTGVYTFDYNQLIQTTLPITAEWLILIGFLAAFLVKLPAFPFHVWLPPLLAESPLAPILTGIMVKTGAYGLMRFALPLFPHASVQIAPVMLGLGVAGVIYGSVLAFSRDNPRQMLAYSTIAHMGLVLIGIFSESDLALSGVVVLLVTQALTSSALLMLFDHVTQSTGEHRLSQMGGLFKTMPKAGTLTMIFIMASIGLPGLGNFIGEWLVLLGTFASYPLVTILAGTGLVLGALYSLRLLQQMFFGPHEGSSAPQDLAGRYVFVFAALVVTLVWIGLYPAPLLDMVASSWREETEAVLPPAVSHLGEQR